MKHTRSKFLWNVPCQMDRINSILRRSQEKLEWNGPKELTSRQFSTPFKFPWRIRRDFRISSSASRTYCACQRLNKSPDAGGEIYAKSLSRYSQLIHPPTGGSNIKNSIEGYTRDSDGHVYCSRYEHALLTSRFSLLNTGSHTMIDQFWRVQIARGTALNKYQCVTL